MYIELIQTFIRNWQFDYNSSSIFLATDFQQGCIAFSAKPFFISREVTGERERKRP